MEIKNGPMLVKTIPKRHIVYSSGAGKATVPEIKWLGETIVKQAAAWKSTGWAYIADCLEMDPVTPDVGNELIAIRINLAENGCKAFAFVDGSSAMLKAQAKSHQKRSSTEVVEEHFNTTEEALEWLAQLSF